MGASSNPINLFYNINAPYTFFTANDGATGRELWSLLILARNVYLPLVIR
jgi:hypothetical protein